ncbi:MAG: hypothetical protein IPK66_07545 [Rhodospirillales bacterium]|nr:hypothetical protein [Rhodospirillales bacterium]
MAQIEHARAQTVIHTLEELQNIRNNPAGAYILGNDIDAAKTASWNGEAGFLPIGTEADPFTGVFNGNGRQIRNLYINSAASRVGLFGQIGAGGVVHNIVLIAGSVTAKTTAYSAVGGLAGGNAGTIANAYARVTVNGDALLDEATGGLVGVNNGTIRKSYAGGMASGADTGGLVGDNFGTVETSFATGRVTGGTGGYRGAGGLAGNNYGSIAESYATGPVSGTYGRVGGFVGFNENGTIRDCYATGAVRGLGILGSAQFFVGGLVGENNGTLADSYSTGKVTGASSYRIGGLIGNNESTVTTSYWDKQTSGRSTSSGGTGLTTAQLKASLPAGFDAGTWSILPTASYPFLL